jgi:hypothetical protein
MPTPRKPRNLNEALKQFKASEADKREDRVNAKKLGMTQAQYARSTTDKKNDLKGAKKLLKGNK